jgi:hypothetical protein
MLEIFIIIRKMTAASIPLRGIRIVPVIRVPTAAPARSAARHPAAGLSLSPIIPATMGN